MTDERRKAAELALGRILRMAARPAQPGDLEDYERCRAIILGAFDPPVPHYQPNYARDRNRGAAGD